MQVKEFSDVAALNAECEARMRAVLGAAQETPAAVMLSGGRTPLALFEKIAEQPFPVGAQAYLTYTDDRYVPAESPESNFGATLPMIRALGLPLAHVLRVKTDLPLAEAADQFHRDLAAFLDAGGTIPLAFLGIGTDGHTCSLFSQEDIDRGAGKLASPTYRPAPPDRVTVTPSLLARCGEIVFLVAGRDKDAVVAQLLNEPGAIPAGRAVAGHPNVTIWRA